MAKEILDRQLQAENVRRLADLDGRTFSANQVLEAASLTADELTNYLSKNKLVLASESPGPGRARPFCLIDVYQLAMMGRLTMMTRRPEWSARALEHLLYSIPLEGLADSPCSHGGLEGAADKPVLMEKVFDYRQKCCRSVRNSMPFYTHRDQDKPWFLFVSPDDVKFKNPVVDLVQFGGDTDKVRFGLWSGMFINTTVILRMVDLKLYRQLHENAA